MNKLFEQGIRQFNEREFYACHDTIEEIWMDSSEPDKTFYQGILQISVACYHLSNSNWRGAVILLGEGIRKLVDYEPEYLDINVTDFTDNSYQLLNALQSINPESVSSFYQQLINNQENSLSLPIIRFC